jgi:hypothetical protein
VSTVSRLARRFHAAVPDEEYDHLDEEVLDYSLLSPDVLPAINKEPGKPTKVEELCEYWQKIGEMKTPDGNIRFPNLTSLFKCITSFKRGHRTCI